MDIRAAFGLVFFLCALLTYLRMEPGIQRFIRMRLNAMHRRRSREGFRMKRSSFFRDGVL